MTEKERFCRWLDYFGKALAVTDDLDLASAAAELAVQLDEEEAEATPPLVIDPPAPIVIPRNVPTTADCVRLTSFTGESCYVPRSELFRQSERAP